MKGSNTRQLAYTGLMTALIFIGTKLINVPTLRGYIHLGDSMIFISAFLLTWKYSALAAGLGSALADLLSPYAIYTLPTFVIKSLMGIIVRCTYQAKKKGFIWLCFLASSFWLITNFTLRYLMDLHVAQNPSDYIEALDYRGISSIEQVTAFTEQLSFLFIISAFVLPLLILITMFWVNKKEGTQSALKHFVGFTFAGMWMVLGYYVVEIILYGNPIIPIFSIPFNILQFIIGIFIAELIMTALKHQRKYT